MTNHRLLYLWVAVAFLALQTGTVQAQVILNGSFENGSFMPDGNGFMSLPAGSTAITGWTTFNAELVWAGFPNTSDWPASDGNFFLDLTGYHDSSPYGGIQQALMTVSGTRYHVTFDLSVNQSSPVSKGPITVRVAATGNPFQDFTYNPRGTGIQWGSFGYDFVAAGPSTDLSFLGTFSEGGATINLDNVQVSAVPESNVGGLVTGITSGWVTCRNTTTGQQIAIRLKDATSWDCETAGLVVNSGDGIVQTVTGVAD